MLLEGTLYGNLLKSLRKHCAVTKEVLGEGIYSFHTMSKVEQGERYPDKLTRDRLLARLGESGVDYECYLQMDEYADWEERRDLLDSLDDLELAKAEKLLMRYEKKNNGDDLVSHQFAMTMRAQYLELSGASREERYRVIEAAVKLTVPEVDNKPLSELLLSIQELNLILEYIIYKKPKNLENQYRQLMDYIKKGRFDFESRAMFASKLALCYCRYLGQEERDINQLSEQERQIEQALEISIWGLEELRNNGKLYFAWELLGLQKQYLEWLLNHRELLSKKKAGEYEVIFEQTRSYFEVLNRLYVTAQVPKKTNSFTCFYREHEIYCINDVIRARRRMFGVTVEELETNLLCGASTLKRIEGNKSKVRMAIVQEMFQYLNLSKETHRKRIVTNRHEALWLEHEYQLAVRQNDYVKAEFLLEQIKAQIPMEELINQQYIEYCEKVLSYSQGNLSKEVFIRDIIKMLEYTIPLDVAMAEIKDKKHSNGRVWEGEKYLTVEEITILLSLASAYDEKGENEYFEVLKEYYEWLEKRCTVAPILEMYGLVMTVVANYLRTMGKYEESCMLNYKILREELKARTLSNVHQNICGLLMNGDKMKFPVV